jgi:F-type H+-transporting ATPase subunit delta
MRSADAVRVADIYARSLAEVARGAADGGDTVERDLEALSTVMTQEPQFRAFLVSPYFSESVKQDMVHKVFDGKMDPIVLNFLLVVVAHHREAVLDQMINHYRQLSHARRGLQAVRATVARPLSDEQRVGLLSNLTGALKSEVELDVRVDPSIIGGIVIHYAGQKVDNSIRTRLHRVVGEIARLQVEHKERV